LVAQAHRMSPAVPGVEVADDGHAACVGRPDGEAHALDAADRHRLGPEAASELLWRPSTSACTASALIPTRQSWPIVMRAAHPFSAGWRQPRSRTAEWPANSAGWRPRS